MLRWLGVLVVVLALVAVLTIAALCDLGIQTKPEAVPTTQVVGRP